VLEQLRRQPVSPGRLRELQELQRWLSGR
jgi:hypothetical protein